MTERTRGSATRDPTSKLAGALALVAFCTGCATPPEQTADTDGYSPHIYRTGSNIPVKDYGAANIKIAPAEAINPINRPMGQAAPRSGG
ncbi:MAG TPA: hypothetical protein VGL43_00245 [Casimicrobiaceae bacterium]